MIVEFVQSGGTSLCFPSSFVLQFRELRNVHIYIKPDTFQKARQFPLRFYIQKAIHLTLRDFHEIFEVGNYIEKA